MTKSSDGEAASIDLSDFDLDDPDLPEEIDDAAMGSAGYPYDKRMKRKKYDKHLRRLQIELLKLQHWARAEGERIVIVFEGRDAAGKGGTIKRFMEYLNPRHARTVALDKPTETELGQWYFQRYVAQLPTAGEIVLFDRSWYNRGGVERVMGFATETQVAKFFEEAPDFEAMLARDGIRLFKFWLTIGQAMQLKRFHARRHDPLKQWKLSGLDLAAIPKWDDYTRAKQDIFHHTHTEAAPWTVVRANDKRRTRINAIRHVLASTDYTGKDKDAVGEPDPNLVGAGEKFFFDA